MLVGKTASAAEYIEALAQRRAAITEFDEWIRDRDALLTPMLPITAKPVSEVDETTYPLATWSRAVNYLGACALAFPAGSSANQLPTSAQMIAKANDENRFSALRVIVSDQQRRPPL